MIGGREGESERARDAGRGKPVFAAAVLVRTRIGCCCCWYANSLLDAVVVATLTMMTENENTYPLSLFLSGQEGPAKLSSKKARDFSALDKSPSIMVIFFALTKALTPSSSALSQIFGPMP